MFGVVALVFLGGLLHPLPAPSTHPRRCVGRGVRVHLCLDRNFVSDIAARSSPSVVLVIPRGVRNITAQGSGFAVEVNGRTLLLTNAHVASGGSSVEVALPADDFVERHSATVIGRAPAGEDLALLRLDEAVAARLSPLTLGDSDALQPGALVVAIGHPAGLWGAVSLGVICGRSSLPAFSVPRKLSSGDGEGQESAVDTVPYLVTDAAFASGMSGGTIHLKPAHVITSHYTAKQVIMRQ